MSNRIQYTNDFSKIVEISFYHEYFANTNLNNIDLIPDSETAELINNYNLILRKKDNSFFIFKKTPYNFIASGWWLSGSDLFSMLNNIRSLRCINWVNRSYSHALIKH